MTELDVKALKKELDDLGDIKLWGEKADAVIAALEGRDRLRAAALAVIESYWTETDDGTMKDLRAALEGRDG